MEIYNVFGLNLMFTNFVASYKRGQDPSCNAEGLCKCIFDDGKEINLMSLGNKDSTPRFQDVLGQDKEYYSYNPCHPFTEGDCKNAASCEIDQNLQRQIKIGNGDMANFFYDAATQLVIVQYTNGQVATLVLLICDHNAMDPVFVPIGSVGASPVFQFNLTSVCACPNGCSDTGPFHANTSTPSLGAGSIICICAACLIFSYLLFGIMYMKFKKKATGLNLLPNREMWGNFSGSIKEGFQFTIRKLAFRKSGYQNI